ncbi:hypothetical protein [Alicyclobacillus sp. SO9]|uniref:hypothetical protein n=1 Tax=Alicyclobacillus sp. SO9 TaxID=2665646 RepID=UPI0018E8EE37|nr:hypothetical protein [Alicyclobacillus sp. SO9]QQE81549.1 hypothetical protein GI364_24935 [Alicyclobacillus sp. SO9]
MHLVRRHVARKKRRYRTYLYIRRSAYKQVRVCPDIPLGRMDRREPKRTVQMWLEDSDNLPDSLRGRLTRENVLNLYAAILNSENWSLLDRFNPQRTPKQDPRVEWSDTK